MKGVKGIIFDWGRTLWDHDTETLFPEAKRVLKYCRDKGYRVSLLSVSRDPATFPEKEKLIASSGIRHFFDHIVISTKKEKGEIDSIVVPWGLSYPEILMVGDRMLREVKIANELGMYSIWIAKGKFAGETPTGETGTPTHTVPSLGAILQII